MSKTDSLSDRQMSILQYIALYSGEHGRPPTIREIGVECNISSTSVVNYNLNKLKDKGFLIRDPEVSRGLRLTDKAEEVGVRLPSAPEVVLQIPVLGSIIAGEPIPTFAQTPDETDDMVDVEYDVFTGKRDGVFALRVSGDSMIDALINDGDIVILESVSQPRNGDMVAAWIMGDDETTLKYFQKDGDVVRLIPANVNYDEIIVPADKVQVQGRVKMVLRQT